MINNLKIKRRLRTLERLLIEINENYIETKRDNIIDCGLEYNKPYSINFEDKEDIKKFNAPDKLRIERELNLFESIFLFTQTFYSLKEYLNDVYKIDKPKIENFFNNRIGIIKRKDICNDLKHKPENDLIYKTAIIKHEIKSEGKTQIISMVSNKSWYYKNVESVEFCNKLYNDFDIFLKNNF